MVTLRTFLAGLGAVVVTVSLVWRGALDTAELGTFARLFELRGPRPPSAPIVVITIDEDSFDELDVSWPFPRALHGKLVDVLSAAQPLVIGFDVVFPEPSSRGPGDDEALGRAIARAGNVVLAAAITTVREQLTGDITLNVDKVDLNVPIPVIRRGAAAVAPVNELLDPDGHLRRAAVRHRLGDEILDGWDLQLYRMARAKGLPVAPPPGSLAPGWPPACARCGPSSPSPCCGWRWPSRRSSPSRGGTSGSAGFVSRWRSCSATERPSSTTMSGSSGRSGGSPSSSRPTCSARSSGDRANWCSVPAGVASPCSSRTSAASPRCRRRSSRSRWPRCCGSTSPR